MQKILKICIPILVIIIGAVIFFIYSSNEVIMNEGYVNGNTAGNLYNKGLFCEIDDTIFFANPSDNGKLYSMDSNGANLKKISNDIAISINADKNYVYYVRDNLNTNTEFNSLSSYANALCRIDHKGNKHALLDMQPSLYAALLGNYIYYIHYDKSEASTLYRVKIDGTEQKKVMNEAVYTCNTDGQYFYYNGMKTDGSIHRFDTSSNTIKTIYNGNAYKPTVFNGTDIYYIDGNSNYALVHTNIETNERTYVTKDSIDSYNIYGDTIYYQRYDKNGSAFCMVKTDGSNPVVLREGNYCDINVTSNFVFFRDHDSNTMYYFKRNNPSEIKVFNPGTAEKKGLFQ